MGGPPLHRTHLVGVEDGLPSRLPQPGGAHGVLPVAAPAIGRLETTLDNLALAATNDTAVLQQLTLANLALTATIGTLTATNKNIELDPCAWDLQCQYGQTRSLDEGHMAWLKASLEERPLTAPLRVSLWENTADRKHYFLSGQHIGRAVKKIREERESRGLGV